MSRRRWRGRAVVLIGTAVAVAACGGGEGPTTTDATPTPPDAATSTPRPPGVAASSAPDAGPPPFAVPSAGATWDYQIGGAYEPSADVEVVVRDRGDAPDPDRYSVCYVNGFQTQSAERAWWLAEHPDLVLRVDGEPIEDSDWPGELILAPTSPERRADLAEIVGGWIGTCAADGYDAVEIDNLDTFTRYPDSISVDDAVAYASELVRRGHASGLAMAQKNTVELLDRLDETRFDFAIVEECAAFDECDAFVEAFDGRVLAVEYDADALADGCRTWPELPFILRDHDVATPDDDGYVRDTC